MKVKLHLLIFPLAVVLSFSCKQTIQKVIEEHPDGTPKKIITYKGEKEIAEISYFLNGNTEIEGGYDANGERTGRWISWYENGKKWSICDYKNGLKHGENIVYYENGNKRYANFYMEGKPSGIWKYWDANGNLQKEINYSKK